MQTVSNPTSFAGTSPATAPKKAKATQNVRPISRPDSVRFGNDGNPQPASDPPEKGGMKGAFKQIGKDLKSFSWWAKQLAISTAITIATCWLPGSQLATIPAWFAISLVSSGFEGYNSRTINQAPKKEETDKTGTDDPATPFSTGEKLKGAATGTFKGAWRGVKDNFKRDLIWGGLVTLATCWLPGSQLIIIPAFMCVSAALGAAGGAATGWKNPKAFQQQTGS